MCRAGRLSEPGPQRAGWPCSASAAQGCPLQARLVPGREDSTELWPLHCPTLQSPAPPPKKIPDQRVRTGQAPGSPCQEPQARTGPRPGPDQDGGGHSRPPRARVGSCVHLPHTLTLHAHHSSTCTLTRTHRTRVLTRTHPHAHTAGTQVLHAPSPAPRPASSLDNAAKRCPQLP